MAGRAQIEGYKDPLKHEYSATNVVDGWGDKDWGRKKCGPSREGPKLYFGNSSVGDG